MAGNWCEGRVGGVEAACALLVVGEKLIKKLKKLEEEAKSWNGCQLERWLCGGRREANQKVKLKKLEEEAGRAWEKGERLDWWMNEKNYSFMKCAIVVRFGLKRILFFNSGNTCRGC
ncbi:hypothetical protein I3760_02G189200 [Carya illinoinensis]|nr:hypothetical protein I3760_02G189200 [Carya illinoinensis]